MPFLSQETPIVIRPIVQPYSFFQSSCRDTKTFKPFVSPSMPLYVSVLPLSISSIFPTPHPSFPPAGREPSNPLANTTSFLPLIGPHHPFCKLTHRPVAMLDTQAWYQEPRVHGALRQPEAPVAYYRHHPPSYEATFFSEPGFGPNTGPRVVDLSAQPPDGEALVDSFPSTYPQDTLFDPIKVELPTNSSIALAPSTLSAPVPQQRIPAKAIRNRFECEDCHKKFDRPSRLDNCRNLHRGIRPWQCGGRCQDPTWFVILSPLIMWSV
jgi:hypothetical protein